MPGRLAAAFLGTRRGSASRHARSFAPARVRTILHARASSLPPSRSAGEHDYLITPYRVYEMSSYMLIPKRTHSLMPSLPKGKTDRKSN